jgi:peptide/nickel transport system substrate-binding protein
VQIPSLIQKQEELNISIETSQTDSILYFLNNNNGELVSSEVIKVKENPTIIKIQGEQTKELGIGANDLKIFAISASVLKPDFYSTSFLVTDDQNQLPETSKDRTQIKDSEETALWVILPIFAIIIIIVVFLKKRK